MNTPIVVALDYPTPETALDLVGKLAPGLCRLKVGKELFVRGGPALVEELRDRGFEVFLDLKFHDIPNTVASAVRAAAELGVWMVNVHASGGRRMMEEAAGRLAGCRHKPLLIGVTVLTSLSGEDLAALARRGERELAQVGGEFQEARITVHLVRRQKASKEPDGHLEDLHREVVVEPEGLHDQRPGDADALPLAA